jgi:hypothetical protein
VVQYEPVKILDYRILEEIVNICKKIAAIITLAGKSPGFFNNNYPMTSMGKKR